MLVKEVVKGGFRLAGSGAICSGFLLPGALGTEFRVKRKPVAKVAAFRIGFFTGVRLGTAAPGAGKVKAAVPAGTKVLSAGTAHTAAQRLIFGNRRTTIPAHGVMITPDGFCIKLSCRFRSTGIKYGIFTAKSKD
jgi:hypothetical protein